MRSGSAPPQLASSSAARDSCILVLGFRASGLIVGICPSWARPLPTFSFLSLTWNQVEWPPCVPSHYWLLQHGNVEKCAVAWGGPPGPAGPEDWGQLWV